MPELAIAARFPLGVYQGHTSSGEVDGFPDTARLLSALLHAAGTGDAAVHVGDRLGPSDSSLDAMRWLERHPPVAIHHPASQRVGVSRTTKIAYRSEGVLDKGGDYKTQRPVSAAVAVEGQFGWLWDDVPEDVRRQVEKLCADVGCLGEADSPVVLSVRSLPPTHRLDPRAGELDRRGIAVRTPTEGRTEELERAHRARHPGKRPTASADRISRNERATRWPVPKNALAYPRYVSIAATTTPTEPWSQVDVLLVGRSRRSTVIRPSDYVSWCVAFHKMLAGRLGDDAPGIITGEYAAGVPRPANRVAIQYLTPAHTRHLGIDAPAFAVLTPTGIDETDAAALNDSLRGRIELWRRSGESVVLEHGPRLSAGSFWSPRTPGTVRAWTPASALVPEIRRQRERKITLNEAALLSLGFVFRDQLVRVPKGLGGYLHLIEQVRERGARASGARRIADSRVDKYVHKLPQGVVAQPYTALLSPGSLAGDQVLIAAGQARHVGGGLLVPVDLPRDAAEAWGLT